MHHGTSPHTYIKFSSLLKQFSRPEAKSLSVSRASGCSVAYAPLGVTNVQKSDLTERNETRRSFHRKSDRKEQNNAITAGCETGTFWTRLDGFVSAKLLDDRLNNTNSSSISGGYSVICAVYTRTQICYVPYYYLLVWLNEFTLFANLYFSKDFE